MNAAGQMVKMYDYRNASGTLLFQVVRYEPKDFRQRRPDGKGGWLWNLDGVLRFPYRLPELLAADPAAWCFVAEGEKDADALAALGLTATTNPGGAGRWKNLADDSALHGRRVCILPDKDAPGRAHALDVARWLHAKAADLRIVELPDVAGVPVKDASDWIEAQDAQAPADLAAALVALADAAPPWTPPAAAAPDAKARTRPAEENGDGVPILVCLVNVKPEPVAWLWPGRIPLGKVTLIYGDPGLGKSLVTLDVAARTSRRTPWPDRPDLPPQPGEVILLSAEDDPADTIRPRLDAAGGDVRRVTLLQGVMHGERRAAFCLADLSPLEAAIQQAPDARLVIIDPISAYLGSADSHKNAEIRGLLAPLADLAGRHRVAVLCVSHMNKSMGGRALYRAMGSLAFAATARAAALVIADADDPKRRLLLHSKMNLAEEPTGLAYRIVPVTLDGIGPVPRVAWESAPINMTADDALAAQCPEGEARSALQEAVDWLSDALASGPAGATEIKKQAPADGIALRTLDRAKEVLRVKATRLVFGGPWLWLLPEHSTPSRAEERQA
jgi:hypothetical protein